jgi:hypothetical protein
MTAESAAPAVGTGPVVAVAFCPAPPLLLPAVEGRPAPETVALREACSAAVAELRATRPAVVVVVGTGAAPGERFGPGDARGLHEFGVDVVVPFAGPRHSGGRRAPLAHVLGAWLLDEDGDTTPRVGVGPDDLATLLPSLAGPVGILAMGEGSARRTLKAPGYLDPAAAPFDAAVATALADGDAPALAALDEAEGERLLAAGVPTWRAVGQVVADHPVHARLLLDDAPFGVGYLVASWLVG